MKDTTSRDEVASPSARTSALEDAAYNAQVQSWCADRDARFARIKSEGEAVYKAVAAWGGLHGPTEWTDICADAAAAYADGSFLLEQLGGERFIEPQLMAVLWLLRRELREQFASVGAADGLLIDLAVLAYANVLRVQGWVGSSALLIEHELFGQPSPTAAFTATYGSRQVSGLTVEEEVARLRETFLPLLDRCSRMLMRSLQVLHAFRTRTAPAVAITQAVQVNTAPAPATPERPPPGSRPRLRK